MGNEKWASVSSTIVQVAHAQPLRPHSRQPETPSSVFSTTSAPLPSSCGPTPLSTRGWRLLVVTSKGSRWRWCTQKSVLSEGMCVPFEAPRTTSGLGRLILRLSIAWSGPRTHITRSEEFHGPESSSPFSQQPQKSAERERGKKKEFQWKCPAAFVYLLGLSRVGNVLQCGCASSCSTREKFEKNRKKVLSRPHGRA